MSTSELLIPYTDSESGGALVTIGNALRAVSCAASITAGIYVAPFRFPLAYDRSRDGHLSFMLSKTPGVPTIAANVTINVEATIDPPPGPPTNRTIVQQVPTPASWPGANYFEVEILDAGLPIFPAHTIPAGAWFGCRLRRIGGDPLDTYPTAIVIPLMLRLTYNHLCAYGDCP